MDNDWSFPWLRLCGNGQDGEAQAAIKCGMVKSLMAAASKSKARPMEDRPPSLNSGGGNGGGNWN